MKKLLIALFGFTAAVHVAEAPSPVGQLVDIGGRKLHLNCSGNGSPIVVVENGASSFSIDWALVQPIVATKTRVCTYDRAGFAWSDRGPTINTVEETMDDLQLLLRTAKLQPPYVLVGASIGGMFVRAFQRRHPEQVAALIFVDATPEDDAKYMVDGKDTAGIDMSYEQMERVYARYVKNPPPPRALPDVIEEPYDRLPKRLQGARLWAQRLLLSQIDMSQSWITAESWAQEFAALRRLRLSNDHVLRNLPLVVVSRGKRNNLDLQRAQTEFAAMSRRGREVIASESDHEIYLYQPDLVAKAILDTVNAARNASSSRSAR